MYIRDDASAKPFPLRYSQRKEKKSREEEAKNQNLRNERKNKKSKVQREMSAAWQHMAFARCSPARSGVSDCRQSFVLSFARSFSRNADSCRRDSAPFTSAMIAERAAKRKSVRPPTRLDFIQLFLVLLSCIQIARSSTTSPVGEFTLYKYFTKFFHYKSNHFFSQTTFL